MSKKTFFKRKASSKLAWSVAAAMTLTAGMGNVVYAQESDDELEGLEEIVITGSRIRRRDFDANSPIVTVDAEKLENRSGLNIESYLNEMPNFNPAAAPTTTQSDVQISAVNSVGIATVSMRGFGANRNLVLVNGKRPTPINALMVTDINGVPSALVERVEIISGGASAVYGADAIGGVTNFILRDNFEGAEFDVQYGASEVGDGEEFRVSGVFGADIADGRGNITVSMEHYERKAALEIERDFYTDSWSDPMTGGDLFVFGYNGYNTGFNPVNAGAVDAIFADRPAGTGVTSATSGGFVDGFRFNPDGSVFSLAGNNLYKFQGTIDGQEYATQRAYDNTILTPGSEIDTLKWNNQEALVSAPQERYSFFASTKYDLTDTVTFFSRMNWAESKTNTLLLPTNASFGWEASIPFSPSTDSPVDPSLNYADPAVVTAVLADPAAYANPAFLATGAAGAQHPVSTEMAMMLLSREVRAPGTFGPDDPGADRRAEDWIMETYPATSFAQRSTENTNTVWQVEAGVDFELPFKDWTGEAYWSHGESSTYNVAGGNNSLSRWRAMLAAPDYGRGAELVGNSDGALAGFGTVGVSCTSGFYDMIFGGDVSPSDDCKYAVEAPLQTRTQNQQDIIELNFQGGLFDLPAGEVRAAAGFQYRDNAAQFNPDILQSTASFTDQVIGVYPAAYLDASTSVEDFYGELLVPVLSDLPFIQQMDLELGFRVSDYEHTDSEETYKILANIEVNDYFRLRGGYNLATRAPNLGELFLNTQEIFVIGGTNFSDPCSLRSTAPYGAGGTGTDPVLLPTETPTQLAAGQTADGAASARMICEAQMGVDGAAYFYSQDSAAAGGTLYNWILQQGNADLTSEQADTWSLGFVFNSPFESPWLSGLTASVDWWQVEITDAIQQYSVDYARYLCYGATTVTNAAEAAAQAASRACQNVSRTEGTGGADSALIEYDNQATIETSGIDLAVNWYSELEDLGFDLPGGFGINVQGTILDYYKTKQSPTSFDVETEWKGSLGPNLSGTNAGAYDYRLVTSFNYVLDDVSVSLRWRFLPSVQSAAYASQQAIIENNQRVAAGGEGITLSYTPSTDIETDSYNIFDLSVNWQINDTFSLRGGIDNLFDEDPAVTGASTGYEYGTDLTAVCDAAAEALGCVDPTAYSLANSGSGTTNSGYYDTLGRRFFLGVKARF